MPAQPVILFQHGDYYEIAPPIWLQKLVGGRMSDWTPIIEPGDLEPTMAEVEADGTVNLHEVVCSDCGEPMDEHGCPNGAAHPATPPTIVTTRSTGPRKKAEEHPPCAHCGGRIHWNGSAAVVNFECIYRQYLLATGKISDPSARLPVLTAHELKAVGDWADDQTDLQYGNMASAGGGGATYSAIRPKAPPKPVKTEEEKKEAKRVAAEKRKADRAAAKAAKSISDVADEVAGAETFDALGGEELAVAVPASEDEMETPLPEKKVRPSRAKAEKPVSLDESRAARREARRKRLAEI
jgi:hypothetical protein